MDPGQTSSGVVARWSLIAFLRDLGNAGVP
jgi:hypothetical protein